MIFALFDDDIYKKTRITHIRHTARAILIDEEDNYLFLHIQGEDEFGKRDHLETVGGGIEPNEQLTDALKREILEEIGFDAYDLEEIGTIIDRYYLINRETHSHYFVAHVDTRKYQKTSRIPLEQALFKDMYHFKEHEVLPFIENNTGEGVNFLINRREYAAFNYYLQTKKKFCK